LAQILHGLARNGDNRLIETEGVVLSLPRVVLELAGGRGGILRWRAPDQSGEGCDGECMCSERVASL